MADEQKVKITERMLRHLEKVESLRVESARLKWKEPDLEKHPQRNEES